MTVRSSTFAVIAALTVLGAMTHSGPLLLGGGAAHAVIGRPLTPASYAGVARRTTRRAARNNAYATTTSPAPTTVVSTSAVVTTLPASCVEATTGDTVIYECDGVSYRPYYNGPTLIYQRF